MTLYSIDIDRNRIEFCHTAGVGASMILCSIDIDRIEWPKAKHENGSVSAFFYFGPMVDRRQPVLL